MEDKLDLNALWQVILKRWKLLVLLTLGAALAGALISIYAITPQYKAKTTLMVTRKVTPDQLRWQDLQTSRELVSTYREMIQSRQVLELAITYRALPYDVDQLKRKVDVQAVGSTELFILNVTDPDPVLARDMANVMVRVFKSQVSEIMQVENVSVIDEAVTPKRPVSPRVHLNIAGAFMAGLMAAGGLAFLLEYLDQSIRDPGEAQKLLQVPVIGVVPKVEGEQLFASSEPRSPPAEALRSLRTNIQYSGAERPVKQIVITGANPRCGKSTVAANLAFTLARGGSSVLLVDADLRRPVLDKIFGLDSEPGLSGLLFKAGLDLESALRQSEAENLIILPSGTIPPNPAEMLASEKMTELARAFERKFDYVLYDSPPVIAVTDAALLSHLADGTLFVLDYGVVRRNEAVEALDHLFRVQAHIIGLVINNMPPGVSYYQGYRYYYGRDEGFSRVRRKG